VDWDVIAAIAEAAGALGVLVSIVYLARQIRMNTRVARATCDLTHSASYRDVAMTIVENPDVSDLFHRGLVDLKSLTAVESQRFAWLIGELFNRFRTKVEGARAGLVSEQQVEVWATFTAALIATPGGGRAWETVRGMFDEEAQLLLREAAPHTPPFNELLPLLFADHSGRVANSPGDAV
jgi:hypothetical protein